MSLFKPEHPPYRDPDGRPVYPPQTRSGFLSMLWGTRAPRYVAPPTKPHPIEPTNKR